MKDENKTKKRDLNELMDLRRQKTKVTKAESKHKRKDEKQEKLEARLRTVIESLPFDFFGIDAKGRYFMPLREISLFIETISEKNSD